MTYDLDRTSMQEGMPLGEQYHRLARYWFWLGVPAFASIVVIYYLMVFKPMIGV